MKIKGVLKRRRNEYGKKIRKKYEAKQVKAKMKDIRDWKVVKQDHSNSLTGLQIDNLIVVEE